MKRKNIIIFFITLLVIVNLIQWWPDSSSNRALENWQDINVSQLQIYGITVNSKLVSRGNNIRNLFYNNDDASDTTITEKTEVEKAPVKSNINTELSGIKLIGVIYKNNHYEAFLSFGTENIKVTVNEYIARRYKVKNINIRSVMLKDMQEGHLHRITIADELPDSN